MFSYGSDIVKIRGGHTPKISGRPLSTVEKLPLPGKLQLSLHRGGVDYAPIVKDGQEVELGDSVAEASVTGGSLSLPSPAAGRVSLDGEEEGASRLILETTGSDTTTGKYETFEPQRITGEAMRDALARGGIWPFFWSSRTGGMPTLDDAEQPRAIVVNCVLTEPFRARGKVILRHAWSRIVQGLRFLPRLLAEYGTIELVLTARRDAVAGMMYVGLAGYAWIRFHPVALRYPVENPQVLSRALRRSDASFEKEDVIWVIDVQGVEALGACLTEGLPLYERMVAVGGPGHPDPRHLCVRIGTSVSDLVHQDGASNLSACNACLRADTHRQAQAGGVRILRGGLLNGDPVDPATDSVQYDDDAFFFLPEVSEREFLSFLRPGFDRTSTLPCSASRITGAYDQRVSTSLRGERRPCIACGLCERLCPAGLLPQVLHRYLYHEALDEAEAAGLDLCVDCGLCTYVCPSKIELQKQFAQAREQLRLEREEQVSR